MKRLFYLLLGIILVCSFRVNALEDDYLTYITTQDTIAKVGTMSASPETIKLKKGTTFKMAYHAGGGNTVILSNGDYADSVKSGTYKLKEPFNKANAHKLNYSYYKTNRKVIVYSDPSALNMIGVIDNGTIVKATRYYGPYYYLTNNKITGWVYVEYLVKSKTPVKQETKTDEPTTQDDEYEASILPSSDDPNIIDEGTYDEDVANTELLPKEQKNKVNTKWLTMAVVLLVLIIILIVSMIIINNKGKKE